ncbi:class F sortase [Actinoplanes palleronii]|uniref:Sortase family protein n=1 Tax=Actinoplanes palleronii TaxID=113570 RepID=A0ABQ4B0U6_9ACTN|nr:class F sortase [Actinoplanes palleronii]GIE64279.1 hypothetical protein Apa02nite_003870 [Actinoplanes palleronii]
MTNTEGTDPPIAGTPGADPAPAGGAGVELALAGAPGADPALAGGAGVDPALAGGAGVEPVLAGAPGAELALAGGAGVELAAAGADSPAATAAGSRWGRYALSAVVLVLAAVGVTALVIGARDQPHQPPLAASVVGAAPPEGAVTTSGTAPSAGAAATSTVGGSTSTSGGSTSTSGGDATTAGDALTVGPLMSTSVPTRVVIPALDVDVPLIGLGLQADGAMQVPTDAKTVGWYTRAPTPGALGPAVLAGHVDFKNKPGTFNKLTDLKAGDSINVDRADGSMAMFRVVKVDRYAKDRFPTDAVYGAINRAGLRLITCGGDFDSAAGHYEDNIVVYADLAMAHPA